MASANLIAFLAEPKWAANEPLRKVLGVLVQKDPDPRALYWEALFNQKVQNLAGKCPLEEFQEALEVYCPEALAYVLPGRKPALAEVPGLLALYRPLEELKNHFLDHLYGNQEAKREALVFLGERYDLKGSSPVSPEDFKKELLNLSLLEFLDQAS